MTNCGLTHKSISTEVQWTYHVPILLATQQFQWLRIFSIFENQCANFKTYLGGDL